MSTPQPQGRLQSAGFSLVELMVAMAIGSVLMVGAVFVFSQSRTTYALNESTARLQEDARYALSMIEPDVQLAGLFGYSNSSDDVSLINGGAATPVSKLRQNDAAAAGLAASIADCGNNFALDFMMAVEGSNDGNFLPNANPPGPGSGCAEFVPRPSTDTLTIRRVSTDPVLLEANRLQLYANRRQPSNQQIFHNGVAPGPVVNGDREIRNVIVRTYYIARDSVGRPGFPALRMISLGAGQAFQDVELIPGVEDMQVQFGVDTGDYDADGDMEGDVDGNGVPEANGIATRYVNPDDNMLQPPPAGNSMQVVTVRLWLRLRSEQPEQGFQDTRNYVYADVNYTPAGAERAFRRTLVTRTIHLRNARTM